MLDADQEKHIISHPVSQPRSSLVLCVTSKSKQVKMVNFISVALLKLVVTMFFTQGKKEREKKDKDSETKLEDNKKIQNK